MSRNIKKMFEIEGAHIKSVKLINLNSTGPFKVKNTLDYHPLWLAQSYVEIATL